MLHKRFLLTTAVLISVGFPQQLRAVEGCEPAEAVLGSIDDFLIEQMQKFPPPDPNDPNGYPEGFENAQLIQTYDVDPTSPHYERADIYDTALAAFYFIKRGMLELARALLDGMRLVQREDPHEYGRTRDVYRADLPLLPPEFVSNRSSIGNLAFQGIALLHFYLATGEHKYLEAAIHSARWIKDNTWQSMPDGCDGFSLGREGDGGWIEGTPRACSIEHNVDVYVLAEFLFQVTQYDDWHQMALHARGFVTEMYQEVEGMYLLGTEEDASDPNAPRIARTLWPHAVDAQALTALGRADDPNRLPGAVDYLLDTTPHPPFLIDDEVSAPNQCGGTCDPCCCDGSASDCCFRGMKFTNNDHPDFGATHIQVEVTAQAAMALWESGREAEASSLLCNICRIRLTAPNHDPDGIGILATPHPDGANTGLSVHPYPNERHVASTVWAGLALMVAEGDPYANPLQLPSDIDGDGVDNSADNCVLRSNPAATYPSYRTTTGGQLDDDADGYGNVCDCNFSGGPICTALDTIQYKTAVNKPVTGSNCGTTGTRACDEFDLDGTSPVITALDTIAYKAMLSLPVGPKCAACPLACVGDACP